MRIRSATYCTHYNRYEHSTRTRSKTALYEKKEGIVRISYCIVNCCGVLPEAEPSLAGVFFVVRINPLLHPVHRDKPSNSVSGRRAGWLSRGTVKLQLAAQERRGTHGLSHPFFSTLSSLAALAMALFGANTRK